MSRKMEWMHTLVYKPRKSSVLSLLMASYVQDATADLASQNMFATGRQFRGV